MGIFENLENLNVSEECYNSILKLIEELLPEDTMSYIKKVHGEPQYYPDKQGQPQPKNKAAELTDLLQQYQKDFPSSKEAPDNKYVPKNIRKKQEWPGMRMTKRGAGEEKTDKRKGIDHGSWDHYYDEWEDKK